MEEILKDDNIRCCKKITLKNWYSRRSYICRKPAIYSNGSHYFCRHHAKVGRFVARVGDIGEIKARFNTEQELRDNIHLYPDCRMQKVTKSHRRDIY